MSDRAGYFPDYGTRSTSEILRDVVSDVQDLLRSEVRLAKAEVSEQAQRAKSAGVYIGGLAIAGLLAAMCFVAFVIALLSLAIPVWAGALIMTFLLGVAGGLLWVQVRNRLCNFHAVPEQTVKTIKEDVEWLKQRTR
jgi:hypothetical protein